MRVLSATPQLFLLLFILLPNYHSFFFTNKMADWSTLPSDAIDAISTRVSNDADYVRFRSVCTSWRSAAPKRRPQLPWLVVEYSVDDDDDGEWDSDSERDGVRILDTFLSLCNLPNTADLLMPPHLPYQGRIRGKYICGSSHGWIAILDDVPCISLHNPFTGLHVRLPLLADLPPTTHGLRITKSDQGFSFIQDDDEEPKDPKPFAFFATFLAKKVVLSSDPATAPGDCIVMAMFYNGEMLAHCRPGDATWTPLSHALHHSDFQDITFYKGRFYAVSKFNVFVCDLGPPGSAQVTEILPANPLFSDDLQAREIERGHLRSYLVVSSGDLLLVAITKTYYRGGPEYNFEVFRVDLDGGQLRLVKLENLGGRTLFLGEKSMSISTGSSSWCKGNCIYYCCVTSKTLPRSPHSANPPPGQHPHRARSIQYDTINIFSMEDGSTSSVTGLSENFIGLHWLTPNLL